MKLINNTTVPSAELERVLVAAGRMVGARTTNVVVLVSRGRGGGMAYECVAVRWGRGRKRRTTDGGAFKIRLPYGDALAAARQFFGTAAHEWCHIREYQLGGRTRFVFSSGPRRPSHDDRPEEQRVYQRLRAKREQGRDENSYADEILSLAVAMEHGGPR